MDEKEFDTSAEETIPVEEDQLGGEDDAAGEEGATWTEEFVVAGEELVDTVMGLVREASVRRVVLKNEEKRILLEVPLVLGLAGIALAPAYASLGLIAALVAECTITVERVEKAAEENASE